MGKWTQRKKKEIGVAEVALVPLCHVANMKSARSGRAAEKPVARAGPGRYEPDVRAS